MTEKATFNRLAEQIPEQDPWRIESRRTGVGIPDVWLRDGAAELKCLKVYPKRVDTPVRLSHELTQSQFIRLNARWRSGGRAFVILQARRLDWYLFAAPDSFILKPEHAVTLTTLKRHCLWYSDQGVSGSDGSYVINDWLAMPLDKIENFRQHSGLHDRSQRAYDDKRRQG